MKNEQNVKDRSIKAVAGSDSVKPVPTVPIKQESNDKASIKTGLLVFAKVKGEMGAFTSKQVGTVDHLDGDNYIKLNKEDTLDKQHRWIPTSWVTKTDHKGIYLSKTEEEFRSQLSKSAPEEVQEEELMNKAV